MRDRTILLAAAALMSVLAPSGARADTLEEALLRAYAKNPNLEAARSVTRAVDEQRTQANAAYGPNLGVNVSHDYAFSRIRGVARANEGSDEGFATTASLNLSQPLFTSGRLAAGVDAASANQQAARADLRATSEQLILDVINAYVSLRRDIELYGVASENYDLLRQQRDVTSARFRLRDATAPDLDQTENRVQLAAGRVIQARASVETSAARYRNLVGDYPGPLAPPPPLPELAGLDALYAEAEVSNPELEAARFVELGSRARVAAERAELGPQIAASAFAQRSPLSRFQNTARSESLGVGVTLSMPLYTGGLLPSRIREAIERNQADQQRVEQARRDARESLASNWSLLRSAGEALPRFESAVRAAQSAVEGVKRQETAGIRTLRDLLDVTNDLLAARTNAVQAESELYFRHAAVLRAAGILTIDRFAPRAAYDPDSYAPPGAAAAGLPLRPVLDPIDRLLLQNKVKPAPVDREDDPHFHWSEETKSLPMPLPAGERPGGAAE